MFNVKLCNTLILFIEGARIIHIMENLNLIFPSKWKPKKQTSLLHELQVILNDFNAYIKAFEALFIKVTVSFFAVIICHSSLQIWSLYLKVTIFLPINKDILWRKIVSFHAHFWKESNLSVIFLMSFHHFYNPFPHTQTFKNPRILFP